MSTLQGGYIGIVAEFNERIAGYMIYELHKYRLHVVNLAVANHLRHQGVGTQMIEKLIGKLSPFGRQGIILEVRETNPPAQIFFRQLGFRAISTLRDFYEYTTEDAYLMEYRLPIYTSRDCP